MSRLPIQPRITLGRALPSGPSPVRPAAADDPPRMGTSARFRERAARNRELGALNAPPGRSKKGRAGTVSGIGRAASRPSSFPAGPGGASFPSVRLPDRSRSPAASRSPAQNARRSLFGAVGARLRRAAGLLGF